MRYFFYTWSGVAGGYRVIGNVTLESEDFFPDKKARELIIIESKAQKNINVIDPLITNIFEFKNKKDYDNYRQGQ